MLRELGEFGDEDRKSAAAGLLHPGGLQTVNMPMRSSLDPICRELASSLVDAPAPPMTLARAMLATDFIAKWRSADLTERAVARSHFRDLCDLIGEEAPTDTDPKGEWYAFEQA
jgi:hypothetical protein